MGRRALSLSGSASDASNNSRCRSSTSSASAALGASASAPAPAAPPVDSAAGADAEKDAACAESVETRVVLRALGGGAERGSTSIPTMRERVSACLMAPPVAPSRPVAKSCSSIMSLYSGVSSAAGGGRPPGVGSGAGAISSDMTLSRTSSASLRASSFRLYDNDASRRFTCTISLVESSSPRATRLRASSTALFSATKARVDAKSASSTLSSVWKRIPSQTSSPPPPPSSTWDGPSLAADLWTEESLSAVGGRRLLRPCLSSAATCASGRARSGPPAAHPAPRRAPRAQNRAAAA
mmetsp:Transcript_26135/g.83894  ORF Transcript_26135/g.83894 Transcript_26135/m.83894 type:complete len:296 (-) Transcript_26135:905-1792(-)